MILKSIIQDHAKFIRCRKTKEGFCCIAEGQANDVRKTLNEFLESLIYMERVSETVNARVG